MRIQLSGLWFRESKNGQVYLTGSFDKERAKELIETIGDNDKIFISAFPNSYKEEGDKKPDWVVYINAGDETNASKSKPTPTKSIQRMALPTKLSSRDSYGQEPNDDTW